MSACLLLATFLTGTIALLLLYSFKRMRKLADEKAKVELRAKTYSIAIERHMKILRDPVLYKAITHRYNNVNGADRARCRALKRELQLFRKGA
jgi:hypothetical protein